jgi:orotate phosphoribosyltransferase
MADDRRAALLRIIREHAHLRLPEPVQLASGEMSEHFVDVKKGLAQGRDLRAVCEAIVDLARERGIEFDTAGGMTMGADQFAHGVAIVADSQWFVIRKEPKGRGTNKLVEGSALGEGVRVLLLEDTVSTGGSIQKAYQRVVDEGATVVLAATVVDRGDICAPWFAERGIPYEALLTYHDLEIPPIGGSPS